MADYELCLLQDKLISVRSTGGKELALSLPEVFAALGENEIEAFTTLQKHQQHSWHAFLVQLAVMTLHKNGITMCNNADQWAKMLFAMTPFGYEAWSLIVPDLAKPAFMQPPVPEGALTGFKSGGNTPDQIDLLITAKNHDLKMEKIVKPEPSHWLFALISLQTMQGFLGSGNYGIARMNGGFASRPCATFRASQLHGRAFLDDVEKCLNARAVLLEKYESYKQNDGLCLLWTEPWDGKKQLDIQQLDPFFIEICRRIRFTKDKKCIQVFCRASDASRIIAKELKGCTGDPWTPVNLQEQKALTINAKGFDYQLAQEIIFGKGFLAGITQKLLKDEAEAFFWGSALVRGQGITEGYHERKIRIPATARKRLLTAAGRDQMGERSQKWVNSASIVRNKVLWPALTKLSANKADSFADMFTTSVDQVFFNHFWMEIDKSDEEAGTSWEILLLGIAEKILHLAFNRVPTTATGFYKLTCDAEGMFNGCKRKHFPHLFLKETHCGTN